MKYMVKNREIMESMKKPTKEQLLRAKGIKMKDILAPNLKILFCGINPGLYSAATGHHFARPGNKFWKALFLSGLTDHLYSPEEDINLIEKGMGITNFVNKATVSAEELSLDDFKKGTKVLEEKVNRYEPRYLVFLGIGAYRLAFSRPKAKLGLQKEEIGETKLWVMPNPSGLNAHFQVDTLADMFKQLKQCAYKVM